MHDNVLLDISQAPMQALHHHLIKRFIAGVQNPRDLRLVHYWYWEQDSGDIPGLGL